MYTFYKQNVKIFLNIEIEMVLRDRQTENTFSPILAQASPFSFVAPSNFGISIIIIISQADSQAEKFVPLTYEWNMITGDSS